MHIYIYVCLPYIAKYIYMNINIYTHTHTRDIYTHTYNEAEIVILIFSQCTYAIATGMDIYHIN